MFLFKLLRGRHSQKELVPLDGNYENKDPENWVPQEVVYYAKDERCNLVRSNEDLAGKCNVPPHSIKFQFIREIGKRGEGPVVRTNPDAQSLTEVEKKEENELNTLLGKIQNMKSAELKQFALASEIPLIKPNGSKATKVDDMKAVIIAAVTEGANVDEEDDDDYA